jgi:hypothetical protein
MVEGEHHGTVVYLESNCEKITNTNFRNRTNKEHHHDVSPFEILPIDMINSFPLDYMHMICEGIVKRCIKGLTTANLPYRMCNRDFQLAGIDLLSLYNFITHDFN